MTRTRLVDWSVSHFSVSRGMGCEVLEAGGGVIISVILLTLLDSVFC